MKKKDNFFSKLGRKGRMENIPMGHTGFGGSEKFTKSGRVFNNDLLDTDYTRQDMGTVRKTRGVG
jgi:hypothetical protein